MNSSYNFNPDDKRMQLAALLQDPTQPYQRAKNPMGTPSSGGGMNDLMKQAMLDWAKKQAEPGTQNANQTIGDFPTGGSNPMSNYG